MFLKIRQCPVLQSNPKITITQQAVCNSGLIQLDHPAYGKTITCSNYYLFLNSQNFLDGVSNPNNERLKSVVEAWLKDRHKMLYKMLYDVINYKDVTSVPSSSKFEKISVLLVYRFCKVFQSNISTCKTF